MSDKVRYGATPEKLRPCEVSLFRKVFLARVGNGATVEAAERQALHACKMWEQRGAFGEDYENDAHREPDVVWPVVVGQHRLRNTVVYLVERIDDDGVRLVTEKSAATFALDEVRSMPVVLSAPKIVSPPITPNDTPADIARRLRSDVKTYDVPLS